MNGVKSGVGCGAIIAVVVLVFVAILSGARAWFSVLDTERAQADAEAATARALEQQAAALQVQAEADLTIANATARQMDAATAAVVADTRAAHALVREAWPWLALASLFALLVGGAGVAVAVMLRRIAELEEQVTNKKESGDEAES